METPPPEQPPIRIRVAWSGPSFAMWMLAMFAMVAASYFASANNWYGFGSCALWAICCTIRSNGI